MLIIYNLAIDGCFDDWLSVDTFMYQYCLERGFGYQIFHSEKDPKDSTIIHRKSFRCSSSGVPYKKFFLFYIRFYIRFRYVLGTGIRFVYVLYKELCTFQYLANFTKRI